MYTLILGQILHHIYDINIYICVYNSLILLQQLYTIYTTYYYYYYYSYHIYYYRTADLSWVPEPDRIRSRAGNWILCRARYRFQIVDVLRDRANGCYDTRGRQISKDSNDDHPLPLLPPSRKPPHRTVGKTSTTRDFIRG